MQMRCNYTGDRRLKLKINICVVLELKRDSVIIPDHLLFGTCNRVCKSMEKVIQS